MKTWKKALAGVLAMGVCCSASVALTAAYLTDRDSEANVFTVGDVKIDLTEDFDQGATLIPGVKLEKDVMIENTGKNDAWVWAEIAIPTELDVPENASENIIHFNYTKESLADWTWLMDGEDWLVSKATIKGVEYNVYTVLYNNPLIKEATTKTSAMAQVYMDPHIDIDPNGDWYHVLGGKVEGPYWNSGKYGDPIMYVSAYGIQAEGFDTVQEAYGAYQTQWGDNGAEWGEPATVVEAADGAALAAAIDGATGPVVVKVDGKYTTNLEVPGGSDVTIIGEGKDTVLSGQIATTASNAGTLTLKNLTVKVDESIVDSTGISQTGKSAIALWGNQTVICENVTFDMSLANSTAITSWWDTGVGTSIIVRDCTFNCGGQRPIRATGNVTVENCTFNDPYRYAVQLTAKASTATELDKAIINFNNNTIVNGENGKSFVYGIQLEGADYGCNNCVINGSGNTIENGGTESAMYYCECGKVEHATITWNTEVPAEHEV